MEAYLKWYADVEASRIDNLLVGTERFGKIPNTNGRGLTWPSVDAIGEPVTFRSASPDERPLALANALRAACRLRELRGNLAATWTPADDWRPLLQDYIFTGDGFIDAAVADSEHDPNRAGNDRHVAAGR